MFQKNYFLLVIFLTGVSFSSLFGQVKINEYSAANLKKFADDHHDFGDWVELYNSGSTAVDLSGWFLTDDEAKPQKWAFPAGTSIQADDFLLIFCSKRNQTVGQLHTNFSLTQTKGNEKIVLSRANGSIVDAIAVEKTPVEHSRCRATDGTALWKYCSQPSPGTTNNGSAQYSAIAKRPNMDVEAGFYTGAQTVSIITDEIGGTTHYTLDGTEPTENSPIYSAPLSISETTVVKAKTFSNDPKVWPSFTRFNTYFIDENFTLAVVSVGADSVIDLANGEKEIRPIGSIEYFGLDKTRKATSFGELNSHGQDSWVNDQRSLDWVSRDEMGYSNAIQEKLFGYSQRDEYQRVILRASGDDNYPGNHLPQHQGAAHIRDEYCQSLALLGGMKLDVRAAERIIVFLNGEYWGVYGLREYPDDSDYTDEYYGQDKFDIQVLETWGDTWAEYGGDQAHDDWKVIRKFILENDMGDSTNFARVKNEINLVSMCDYFICGLNFVASDWINYNTAWWRGTNPAGDHKKWGYLLWDFDATFDYYINYSGVPNTSVNAKPCDIETISDYCQNDFWNGITEDTCQTFIWMQDTFTYCQRVNGMHDVIFLKLQEENEEFRQLYYSRQADLQSTVFSCENMLYVLDSMVNVIKPEMQRHCQRWSGSKIEWENNVKALRTFVSQRCTRLDNGMVSCFDLTGPYPITLLVEPPGAGEIDFNTLRIENFTWTGQYFGNMENIIDADDKPGYDFSHWETRSGNTISPSLTSVKGTYSVTKADTLIAVFTPTTSTWESAKALGIKALPTLVDDFTNIEFSLPEAMPVRISMKSVDGRQIADWNFENLPAGKNRQRLDFEKRNLPAGMYWLDFQAGKWRGALKLTVVE